MKAFIHENCYIIRRISNSVAAVTVSNQYAIPLDEDTLQNH